MCKLNTLKRKVHLIIHSNLVPSDFGDRKQVSIVEDEEVVKQNAKKKREKFKRQDTPLHPHSIRQAIDDQFCWLDTLFVSSSWLKSCLQTGNGNVLYSLCLQTDCCWWRPAKESFHQCQPRVLFTVKSLWKNEIIRWEAQGKYQLYIARLIQEPLSLISLEKLFSISMFSQTFFHFLHINIGHKEPETSLKVSVFPDCEHTLLNEWEYWIKGGCCCHIIFIIRTLLDFLLHHKMIKHQTWALLSEIF